jgi:protein-S-isoprenylcysteine O-methyltransferase Ste14
MAGMLMRWPIIATAAMRPVLIFMRYRLVLREEREMEASFDERSAAYTREVPILLPFRIIILA